VWSSRHVRLKLCLANLSVSVGSDRLTFQCRTLKMGSCYCESYEVMKTGYLCATQDYGLVGPKN